MSMKRFLIEQKKKEKKELKMLKKINKNKEGVENARRMASSCRL